MAGASQFGDDPARSIDEPKAWTATCGTDLRAQVELDR